MSRSYTSSFPCASIGVLGLLYVLHIYVSMYATLFDGVMLHAIRPKARGFKPGISDGFLMAIKVRSLLRRRSKAGGHMS
jgi:hypothetical protein